MLPLLVVPSLAVLHSMKSEAGAAPSSNSASTTTVYFAGSNTAARISERSYPEAAVRAGEGSQRAALRTVASSGSLRRVADPLAFLEGKANCALISKEMGIRYSNIGTNFLLQEEHRHVSQETCTSPKFSACNFSWCEGQIQHAAVEVTKSAPVREIAIEPIKAESAKSILPTKTAEVSKSTAALKAKASINTESLIDESVQTEVVLENVKSAKPMVAEAPKASEIPVVDPLPAGDAIARANESDLAEEKLHLAKLAEDKIAMAKANEPAFIRPAAVATPPGMVPVEEAQKKLEKLISERDKRAAARIALRKAEEEDGKLKWVMFSVPGAIRPPRLSAVKNERASQLGGTLSNHVARAEKAPNPAEVPIDHKEAVSARLKEAIRLNDPTLSNAQDEYFRSLNSGGTSARGKLTFPGAGAGGAK